MLTSYATDPRLATTAFALVVSTMLPVSPCSRNVTAASSATRYAPVTLMSNVSPHCSSLMCPVVSGGTKTPAVTATPSKPPYASDAWSSMARTLARLVMLQASPTACPHPLTPVPATPMPSPTRSVISFAVASAADRFRSTQTTCAPSLTSRWAASRPIPLPAPTTTITFRASSFSAGIRRSFASSSSQYSMSNASCCGSATYRSIASAPRITSTAQL